MYGKFKGRFFNGCPFSGVVSALRWRRRWRGIGGEREAQGGEDRGEAVSEGSLDVDLIRLPEAIEESLLERLHVAVVDLDLVGKPFLEEDVDGLVADQLVDKVKQKLEK
ncbi:hypothetical protein ACOSQ2_012595 [Xanthoceras sorbifolium]